MAVQFKRMHTAKVQFAGSGLEVADAISHPAGLLFSGGFDTQRNILYLASAMGHPRGVSLAGGEAAEDRVAGMRVLVVASGDVYWATDSMSLPRGLNDDEAGLVQTALELHFRGSQVHRVDKFEALPRNVN
jgi:hypothetical protein